MSDRVCNLKPKAEKGAKNKQTTKERQNPPQNTPNNHIKDEKSNSGNFGTESKDEAKKPLNRLFCDFCKKTFTSLDQLFE